MTGPGRIAARAAVVALVPGLIVLIAACAGGDDGPAGPADPTVADTPNPSEVADALCSAEQVVTEPAPAVRSDELAELSGLVASRTQDQVWWAHNDSGNEARLYAVGPNGEDLGSTAVAGAANVDWEDLAVAPDSEGGGGADLLYIADIGNNLEDRGTVTVEVVREPDLANGPPDSVAVERSIELIWPDGPRNAEALMVDPRTGELVIVTQRFGGRAEVHVADGAASGPTPLTKAGTVDLRAASTPPDDGTLENVLRGLGAATAADVTAAGDAAIVRTYGTALVWPRAEDRSLAGAIVDGRPCEAPTAAEGQGEAIALDPDGGGYRTIGEGRRPPVNVFRSGPVSSG